MSKNPNTTIRFFILTGDPGIGKTTLTKKISSLLEAEGVKVNGFITEEVRNKGVREGFDVVTSAGVRGRWARDQDLITIPIKRKMGKYGVFIEEFENIALPCLNETTSQPNLLVIDEIGSMELSSKKFKNVIENIFSSEQNSYNVVLATIPVKNRSALVENIRSHPKAKVGVITKKNRNKLHEEVINEMKSVLSLI
ncbi:ATP binding protein [Bombyx mori]|uniref:ATP binding protein n=1 Tax=Bombyx mori TaxID=7091 RepID=Q2F631_BOMMO|nr:ATP binding protein [Bombyx mori]ABD36186.1 ATP binding protein [Bombyx mori]